MHGIRDVEANATLFLIAYRRQRLPVVLEWRHRYVAALLAAISGARPRLGWRVSVNADFFRTAIGKPRIFSASCRDFLDGAA
jgi:hypothetical protein